MNTSTVVEEYYILSICLHQEKDCWHILSALCENSSESTFDIMLRPHIVRLFPSHIHLSFNFHSILLQLLLSINTQLETKTRAAKEVVRAYTLKKVTCEKMLCEEIEMTTIIYVQQTLWNKFSVKCKYWQSIRFHCNLFVDLSRGKMLEKNPFCSGYLSFLTVRNDG